MQLSRRLSRIKPSATLAVSAKAAALRAQGVDIISLGTGEPDFDTPDHVKEAAREAMRNGQTRYTAVDGTPALKQAIVAKFKRENALDYAPEEIIVSNGAKHSLYNLMMATLDPGDEVLVPAPYWVSYPDMAALCDANAKIVNTGAANHFKLGPDDLTASISSKTRMLILNSPSNPTGQAYSPDELRALAGVLADHPDVLVVCDDIYEHIYWGDAPLKSILAVAPELRERCVLVNGVSKAYAMTGWRIGYLAGPVALVTAMRKIQSQSTSNPCSISQAAAVAALGGPQDSIDTMRTEFRKRHDYLIAALNDIPGVSCLPADGAFYAFPSFEELINSIDDVEDDVAMAQLLLEQAGVALVPGTAFGAPGHLRLSYATSMKNLEEAIMRIRRFAESR